MLFLILVACLFGVTYALPSCPMRPTGPTAEESSANRTLGDGGYKIFFSEPSDEYEPDRIYTITVQGSPKLKLFERFILTMHSQRFPTSFFSDVGYFEESFERFSRTFFISRCFDLAAPSMSKIQVKWQAPKAGSGCVVFTAMVLENNERWYAEDGALTKTVCEEFVFKRFGLTRQLKAENTEDESKRSHVKLIQNRYIALPNDPVHLAKIKGKMHKKF